MLLDDQADASQPDPGAPIRSPTLLARKNRSKSLGMSAPNADTLARTASSAHSPGRRAHARP